MLKFKNERVVPDCVIRISSEKDISKYVQAMVIRGQPYVYDKYECIKIRFTKEMESQVKYLCRMFWNWGAIIHKKVNLKNGIPIDKGVIVTEGKEVILKKIPAITDFGEEDFEEAWKEKKYEEEE